MFDLVKARDKPKVYEDAYPPAQYFSNNCTWP